MAKKVEFIKADEVNKKSYGKGDTLSVSESIYGKLNGRGSIKDYVEKKKKKEV